MPKKPKDILAKPVHIAVLKPSHIEKLKKDGKLPKRAYALDTAEPSNLPKEPEPPVSGRSGVVSYQRIAGTDMHSKSLMKAKLKVIHDRVPPIPKDKRPPCDTCKVSPCCYAFLVELTEDEYLSGVYGDAAVKLEPEDMKSLRTGLSSLLTLRTPARWVEEDKPRFALEGAIGEPCPFLGDDAKCTIYDKRPITCRVYSCVGDDRITEEMRQGEVEDLAAECMKWLFNDK